ncbi:hypothetical protein Bca4012_067244 [Brassica carinata]
MGDASSQLKTTYTLNGSALRTDEVESNLNNSWFHRDVIFDVQNRGFVAEEQHQLLNNPNHILKPEEAENQCGKAWLKTERLAMEYYDPKPGEFVVGIEDLLFLVAKTNSIFLVHGKVGIVKDDDEDGVEVVKFARQGMHVVEIRTMIFAEVLGRTLSGRLGEWQIKQLNVPNDVKITKCNIGWFLTRPEVGHRLIVQST